MSFIRPDLLNDDCSNISLWTDGDTGNGVSDESPAGQFRFSGHTATTPNYAKRYQTISSPPTQFTLEIKTYFDNMAAGFNEAKLWYFSLTWSLLIEWIIGNLYVGGAGGIPNQVGSNLVLYNASAAWQTWRFQIDNTNESAAVCEVFLNGVSQGTVDCSLTGNYSGMNGLINFWQYGQTTDNMMCHLDYLMIGTGLGVFGVAMSLSDTITLSDSIVKSVGKSLTDSLTAQDVFSSVISYNRTFTDALTLSDSLSKLVQKTFTDNVTLSDSMSKIATILKSFSDTLTLSDQLSFTISSYRYLSFSDVVTLSDTLVKEIEQSYSDSLSLVDNVVKTVQKPLSDGVTITDNFSKWKVVPLDYIYLTPVDQTLPINSTQQYTLKGVYSDGTEVDLTALEEYFVSNTSLANIDGSGVLTTFTKGQLFLFATYQNLVTMTNLYITEPPDPDQPFETLLTVWDESGEDSLTPQTQPFFVIKTTWKKT